MYHKIAEFKCFTFGHVVKFVKQYILLQFVNLLIRIMFKEWLFSILAHLSWRLKWAFLITMCSSSVIVVVNFSHFRILHQNHWPSFNQTWHNASLGRGNSSLFKWRTPPISKGRCLWNSENTLTKFKNNSSPEPLGQFQPILAQSELGWCGLKFVQMKNHSILKKQIIGFFFS